MLAPIGAGGMGEVYRVLASLNHPSIAHLNGFEPVTLPDGWCAHRLAMEVVPDRLRPRELRAVLDWAPGVPSLFAGGGQ